MLCGCSKMKKEKQRELKWLLSKIMGGVWLLCMKFGSLHTARVQPSSLPNAYVMCVCSVDTFLRGCADIILMAIHTNICVSVILWYESSKCLQNIIIMPILCPSINRVLIDFRLLRSIDNRVGQYNVLFIRRRSF